MNKYILFDTANHCDIKCMCTNNNQMFSSSGLFTYCMLIWKSISYIFLGGKQMYNYIWFSHLLNGLSKYVRVQTI